MEQRALKNVSSCWNPKFSFYFETPGGQSSDYYLNVAPFFNIIIN
jgi:hypothetical protein